MCINKKKEKNERTNIVWINNERVRFQKKILLFNFICVCIHMYRIHYFLCIVNMCVHIHIVLHACTQSWGTIKRTSDLENERKQERKKKWESDWVYWFGMIAKRIKNIIYRFLALNIFCTIDRASILRIIQYDLTLFIEFYFCHSLQ